MFLDNPLGIKVRGALNENIYVMFDKNLFTLNELG